MKSNADIIYNHIVGSCNDNIEKIELGGDYASIYPDKIVVDNNIKNSLVSNIIKNIELKVSQIHGEMQKDLIILKGNDHWANGLHKYKSIERDIPYIIYRVLK